MTEATTFPGAEWPRKGSVEDHVLTILFARHDLAEPWIDKTRMMHVDPRLSNERMIRLAVQRLRDSGWPIISESHAGCAGYWLTTDPRDVDLFVEHEYDTRIRSELRTRSAMRRAARLLRAQAGEPVMKQARLFA